MRGPLVRDTASRMITAQKTTLRIRTALLAGAQTDPTPPQTTTSTREGFGKEGASLEAFGREGKGTTNSY